MYCLKQGFPTWETRPPCGTWEVARGDAEKKIWILSCDFGVFFGLFVRKCMKSPEWGDAKPEWGDAIIIYFI